MTRRHYLVCLASGMAMASEPWKRDPANWSATDKRAMLNHSPWAVTVKVDMELKGEDITGPRSGGVIGPMEGPPGGNGTVGPPGGAPARAGGGIKQSLPGDLPQFKALVRWESALPMRLAANSEPPAPYQYKIAIIGFPILRNDIAAALSTLQNSGRINRSGHEPLRAVRAASRDTDLIFTFNGELDPITLEERQVLFSASYGAMHVRTKFLLKDMLYEKALAL